MTQANPVARSGVRPRGVKPLGAVFNVTRPEANRGGSALNSRSDGGIRETSEEGFSPTQLARRVEPSRKAAPSYLSAPNGMGDSDPDPAVPGPLDVRSSLGKADLLPDLFFPEQPANGARQSRREPASHAEEDHGVLV